MTKNASKTLSDLISLKGKRALITGAAVGIGRAIAHRFAEAGADLQLVDLDARGLGTARSQLSHFAQEIETHRVDLSTKEKIDALWEELTGREPDILVNNAGIFPFKDFLEVDEAFLEKVMSVNLKSTLWMCQHMIRRRLRKGGVIINIGSIEAILPFEKHLSAYSVSKTGVIALTRSLAKEYGSYRFRVNALIPGGIVTPGTKAVAREIAQGNVRLLRTGVEFKLRLPIGRGGQPDEVARAALFLASDMSSYVHGALIPVDGGFLSA